jgi:hypothetical protein
MTNPDPHIDFEPNKLKHVAVLIFSVFLMVICVYLMPQAILRVVVAVLLLVPILQAADGLGLSQKLNRRSSKKSRDRQYNALRARIGMLLDVVRRLHWLAVDKERGLRNQDDVQSDLDGALERLEEIFEEIRHQAVQVSPTSESFGEPPSGSEPASEPLSEPPVEDTGPGAEPGD